MVELVPQCPSSDHLPLVVGNVELAAVNLGPLTSIAPFANRQQKVSQILETAYGFPFPDPNMTSRSPNARIFWFGRDMAILAGVAADPALAEHAALTDQSDAWASVILQGSCAEDVLARQVPVDLRTKPFPVGQTCRTLIGHMAGSVTRVEQDAFLILVFRSMVGTLLDELKEAMEALAARG